MPVMSYLAYPVQGRHHELVDTLSTVPGCHVLPADNRELLVLVTDTPNDHAERALQEHLQSVASLACLTLVFGHGDDVGAIARIEPAEGTR
jgi:nitrate reductase NapAB chaperone NapD